MSNFIKKIIAPYKKRSKSPHSDEDVWCVIANIKKEIPYGSEGAEIKSGLKKFKAGAKVHIIGAFDGMGESIIVIGQHRQAGKYISCVIKANTVDNLRVKKVYSKKVLELLQNGKEHNNGDTGFPTEGEAEELAMLIPKWALQI